MKQFSPQQLAALLSFNARWVSKTFPRQGGKVNELDVVGWMNRNRACRLDPPFIAAERLLTPSECAKYFPGNMTAQVWRARMRDGKIHRCIRTEANDWRAPVHSAAKFIEG